MVKLTNVRAFKVGDKVQFVYQKGVVIETNYRTAYGITVKFNDDSVNYFTLRGTTFLWGGRRRLEHITSL